MNPSINQLVRKDLPDVEKRESVENKKEEKSKEELFERWKKPEKNTMGNDIASEIKIANSGGEREGGSDKRWHMGGENE
ncbi:MAG: hypothetical protein ABI687_07105 [Flavitalea sp.]